MGQRTMILLLFTVVGRSLFDGWEDVKYERYRRDALGLNNDVLAQIAGGNREWISRIVQALSHATHFGSQERCVNGQHTNDAPKLTSHRGQRGWTAIDVAPLGYAGSWFHEKATEAWVVPEVNRIVPSVAEAAGQVHPTAAAGTSFFTNREDGFNALQRLRAAPNYTAVESVGSHPFNARRSLSLVTTILDDVNERTSDDKTLSSPTSNTQAAYRRHRSAFRSTRLITDGVRVGNNGSARASNSLVAQCPGSASPASALAKVVAGCVSEAEQLSGSAGLANEEYESHSIHMRVLLVDHLRDVFHGAALRPRLPPCSWTVFFRRSALRNSRPITDNVLVRNNSGAPPLSSLRSHAGRSLFDALQSDSSDGFPPRDLIIGFNRTYTNTAPRSLRQITGAFTALDSELEFRIRLTSLRSDTHRLLSFEFDGSNRRDFAPLDPIYLDVTGRNPDCAHESWLWDEMCWWDAGDCRNDLIPSTFLPNNYSAQFENQVRPYSIRPIAMPVHDVTVTFVGKFLTLTDEALFWTGAGSTDTSPPAPETRSYSLSGRCPKGATLTLQATYLFSGTDFHHYEFPEPQDILIKRLIRVKTPSTPEYPSMYVLATSMPQTMSIESAPPTSLALTVRAADSVIFEPSGYLFTPTVTELTFTGTTTDTGAHNITWLQTGADASQYAQVPKVAEVADGNATWVSPHPDRTLFEAKKTVSEVDVADMIVHVGDAAYSFNDDNGKVAMDTTPDTDTHREQYTTHVECGLRARPSSVTAADTAWSPLARYDLTNVEQCRNREPLHLV
ncbi:hypothetical protein DIPPA_28538 [Diplonema papillatum]|nr:hypothetical protein DIPPA_28538 [Diplonema papillatum]